MAHADGIAFLRVGIQIKYRRSCRLHNCSGETALIAALGKGVWLLDDQVILELINTYRGKLAVKEVVLSLTVRLPVGGDEEG